MKDDKAQQPSGKSPRRSSPALRRAQVLTLIGYLAMMYGALSPVLIPRPEPVPPLGTVYRESEATRQALVDAHPALSAADWAEMNAHFAGLDQSIDKAFRRQRSIDFQSRLSNALGWFILGVLLLGAGFLRVSAERRRLEAP